MAGDQSCRRLVNTLEGNLMSATSVVSGAARDLRLYPETVKIGYCNGNALEVKVFTGFQAGFGESRVSGLAISRKALAPTAPCPNSTTGPGSGPDNRPSGPSRTRTSRPRRYADVRPASDPAGRPAGMRRRAGPRSPARRPTPIQPAPPSLPWRPSSPSIRRAPCSLMYGNWRPLMSTIQCCSSPG